MKERSVKKLAFSFCLGIYIAFSPFVGFHTIMVFVLAWLLSLNTAVLFASTYLINNPWTMVPIYTSDYVVGSWFLSWFYQDAITYNPEWMNWINVQLAHYIGIQHISLWAFLIGGNLLGITLGFMFYPVMKKVFEQLLRKKGRTS